MTLIKRNILLIAGLIAAIPAFSQTTASSPYSQFGIGILNGSQLPQSRALGGVSAGLRHPGSYSTINPANPASYSAMDFTTFDIGLASGISNLSKGSASERNFNASLSHIAFGVPITKRSALSFGLMPYSTVNYRLRDQGTLDTSTVNHIYNGEGGLSKAHFGYGLQLGKHLSVGANVSYLFGKIESRNDTEYPDDPGFLSTRTERNNSINGFNYDLGLQFFSNVSKNVKLTVGYTASIGSKLNSTSQELATVYSLDAAGNESTALDTIYSIDQPKVKMQLPTTHTFGFAFERSNKWFIAVDGYLANWESLRTGGARPANIRNASGVAVGWQIIPDITSISSYWKLIEYRLGFRYDQTYVNYNSNNIDQTALTLGLGLPLPSTRSTFYKINLGAEIGQRGTLNNNMVRERFVNIHLGFLINDKWFQRYRFD